jgi:aspartyl-tRNA(Asn)/glutamyl-tRNA(Gln) amidotransferase subunit A
MNLDNLTINKIHNGLVAKEFSATELTKFYLEKIQKEDKKIFSFLEVINNSALLQAERVDKLISEKKDMPLLAGVPIAIKDNISVKDVKVTCASEDLKNYIASYDATCVKKLKKEEAVILGKTNLDEFAMGSSTENSVFGPTRNPWDTERVPGGSSGGSVAAVASDFCCCALGSDTGGSIRQPASFCGVVGLKPTYGAVSRYGLVAFASSLDQIGPITKTSEDAEILFNIIKGRDPRDSTSVNYENSSNSSSELKIGVPKEYFVKGIDNEVKKAVESAIEKAERGGAKIEKISLPHTQYALAAYYLIATSEASSNLARYDGVRYGLAEKGNSLLDVYLKTRAKGLGDEVKRRIMLGTYALSAGYYDAFYLKAQKVRTLIKEDFNKAFKKVDLILAPVSPTTAFKIGERISDPLSMYLADIFTVSVNLAGIPAISVPIGEANGLPVGLQIIGKPFKENVIFRLAKIYK